MKKWWNDNKFNLISKIVNWLILIGVMALSLFTIGFLAAIWEYIVIPLLTNPDLTFLEKLFAVWFFCWFGQTTGENYQKNKEK